MVRILEDLSVGDTVEFTVKAKVTDVKVSGTMLNPEILVWVNYLGQEYGIPLNQIRKV